VRVLKPKGENMENQERTVVGLDMSLTGTGFCVKRGSTINVETIKTDTKTCSDDLARLKYIVAEVMKRIPKDTKMICIEDFFTPANAFQIGSAIKLAMLGSAIRIALYDSKLPFYIVAPSQVKKYVTGSGASQKSIIVREVFKRYGIEVKDDNQADACSMAHLADHLCFLPEDAPKYQVEVVKKVLNERPCYNIPGKPARDA
jgi:crossover junction endodeoxyribonuclease RuvC